VFFAVWTMHLLRLSRSTKFSHFPHPLLKKAGTLEHEVDRVIGSLFSLIESMSYAQKNSIIQVNSVPANRNNAGTRGTQSGDYIASGV